MKTSHLIVSAFHFLHAIILIVVGLICVCISRFAHIKLAFLRLMEKVPNFFGLLGLGCMVAGLVLFTLMFTLFKKTFYSVSMKVSTVELDPAVIRSYVLAGYRQALVSAPSDLEVVVQKDQTIAIFTKLPLMSVEESKKSLLELEQSIGSLLKKHLGYEKKFFLNIGIDS
ncbi:MAG: hypothetical protein EBZ47_00055 [Chlamydiae bacterium]|nr:hypothetical protein [Chlamydiota bacterium]